MKTILSSLGLLLAASALTSSANAQDLLAGKPIFPLGEAKTWTSDAAGEYTFVTSDLEKLVATPTNTSNVYLFPEAGGGWNTDANKAIGIQGFYIDMEESTEVATVSTTWEGAAASAYSIYLTEQTPTLDVLNTEPVYSASGLGQYTANTALLPEGAKGRYLVFQPTDATNYGWGVKIRSISATAPAEDQLTAFSVSPAILMADAQTPLTITLKNQFGLDIDPAKVEITVSDNATLTDGAVIVNSGTEATVYAKLGDTQLEATVYVATAPGVPAAEVIKTPVFTNTVTEYNSTAGWMTGYNGGAVDNGTITFADGEVAQSFADTRCVFFYNTATTGGWNGTLNPLELGYRTLHLDIFGTKDCSGSIEFEGTDGVIDHTQPFTLVKGEWNAIDINIMGETRLNNMSVRFNQENSCDILLANIYFTAAYVEGDETAPVLSEVEAVPAMTSVELSFSATDDLNPEVYYTVTDGSASRSISGKSGETVTLTFDGLNPLTEYTFTVTASDGKNVSDAKSVTVKTTGIPAAPTPDLDEDKVLALYSRHYDADTLPRFDNWGSAAYMATATDENDDTLLYFQNYMGQWGGLVDLDTELPEGTQKLHLDIYGDADGSLTIAPVWKDASGDTPNKKLDVVKGEWNSYDLDISEFGYPENGNTVIQLALTESTLPSFLIDNIYFWSNSTLTAVDFNFDDADSTVDVYSLQGVCLRRGVDRSEATAGLPAGIYIVGGRKVIVRR